VKTGSLLTPPARQDVEGFPVRVAGDDVEVEVDLQSGALHQGETPMNAERRGRLKKSFRTS